MADSKNTKGAQAKAKISPQQIRTPPQDKSQQKGKSPKTKAGKSHKSKSGPCPWLCNLVPIDLPAPDAAQTVLHPRKDVFILKVAKVGANGDRRCKMELELVTPKGPEQQALCRTDTRETQCEPEPPPHTCCSRSKKKKK